MEGEAYESETTKVFHEFIKVHFYGSTENVGHLGPGRQWFHEGRSTFAGLPRQSNLTFRKPFCGAAMLRLVYIIAGSPRIWRRGPTSNVLLETLSPVTKTSVFLKKHEETHNT